MPGAKVFTRSANTGKIQTALRVLQVDQRSGFTWKAARAGRATELAAQGMSLAQIMDMGEWQSRAVLAYIDESTVDAAEMLRLAELEDEEPEAA